MNEDKKRHLDELSIEDLEEALRKKRMTTQSAVNDGARNTRRCDEGSFGPSVSTLSLRVALNKLQGIFDDVRAESKTVEFPAEHALFLLRSHPTILAESFWKRTVLSFFLQARVPLSVMQALCALLKEHTPKDPPMSLVKSYDFHRSPNAIADACIYGPCADGVLQYLLEEFPDHALLKSHESERGLIPIELFLERATHGIQEHEVDYNSLWLSQELIGARRPSSKEICETMETMIAVHPGMLESCNFGEAFLKEMLYNQPADDILIIFNAFARRSTVNSFTVDLEVIDFTPCQFLAFTKILPRLEILDVEDIDEDHFSLLVTALYNLDSPRIVKLKLPLSPDALVEESKSSRHMIQKFIKSCLDLKELAFTCSEDNANQGICMQLCTDIIKSNPGLESFALEGFKLDNSAGLSEVVSSLSATVRTFKMRECSVSKPWCLRDLPSNCALQKVELLRMDLREEWVNGLLLQLVLDCSSLVKLILSGYIYDDGGEREGWEPLGAKEVVEAVLTANRITYFQYKCLSSYNVDVSFEAIPDMLANNTALKELRLPRCEEFQPISGFANALKHHNSTLERLIISGGKWKNTEAGSKIGYYTMLNRFGRVKLQKGEPSLVELAGLLEVANEDESLQVDYPRQLSILFGLLLERPSLWAAGLAAALSPAANGKVTI